MMTTMYENIVHIIRMWKNHVAQGKQIFKIKLTLITHSHAFNRTLVSTERKCVKLHPSITKISAQSFKFKCVTTEILTKLKETK